MPKETEEKIVRNLETNGNIWTWSSYVWKNCLCFRDDNVRSVITLLQNKDPIFEKSLWKNLGLHFAARCLAPAAEAQAEAPDGVAENLVLLTCCWNQKE